MTAIISPFFCLPGPVHCIVTVSVCQLTWYTSALPLFLINLVSPVFLPENSFVDHNYDTVSSLTLYASCYDNHDNSDHCVLEWWYIPGWLRASIPGRELTSMDAHHHQLICVQTHITSQWWMVTSDKCTSAQTRWSTLYQGCILCAQHFYQFYMTKFHFYVYYNILNIPTDVQHMYKTQVTHFTGLHFMLHRFYMTHHNTCTKAWQIFMCILKADYLCSSTLDWNAWNTKWSTTTV